MIRVELSQQQFIRPPDELCRWSVAINAELWKVDGNAPQVDIDGAAEVCFIAVAGKLVFKVPIQGQSVEMILQDIGMVSHGAGHVFR